MGVVCARGAMQQFFNLTCARRCAVKLYNQYCLCKMEVFISTPPGLGQTVPLLVLYQLMRGRKNIFVIYVDG